MIDVGFVNEVIQDSLQKQPWSQLVDPEYRDEKGRFINVSIIIALLQEVLLTQLDAFSEEDLSIQKQQLLAERIIQHCLVLLAEGLLVRVACYSKGSPLSLDGLDEATKGRITEFLEKLVGGEVKQVQATLALSIQTSELTKRSTVTLTPKKTSRIHKVAEHTEHVTGGTDHGAEAVESVADMLAKLHHFSDSMAAHHSLITMDVVKSLDFLLTPSLYLACYLEGHKVPATAHNNFRWAASAVGLGLVVTALAFPPAAAGIVIGLAGAGLITAGYTLGRHFYKRGQLRSKIKSLRKQQHQLHAEVIHSKDELSHQQKLLDEALLLPAHTSTEIVAKQRQIEKVKARLEAIKQEHQAKLTELQVAKDDLHASFNSIHSSLFSKAALVTKSFSCGIGAVALTGAVLALFIPPVGLGLLAASAVAGGLLIVGKPVKSLFKKAKSWFKSNSAQPKAVQQEPEALHDELSEKLHLDSTATVMQSLYGDKAEQALIKLSKDAHHLVKVDRHLHRLIAAKNRYGVIKFFVAMGEKPGAVKLLEAYAQELVYLRPAAKLLNRGIRAVLEDKFALSQADREVLTQGEYANQLIAKLKVSSIRDLRETVQEQQSIEAPTPDPTLFE